jgi:hypothetical protein
LIIDIDKAIFNKITTLGYDVFDISRWSNIESYPHIFIGDNNIVQLINKQNLAIEVVTTLHVFSNYQGTKEIKDIANDLIANINHTLEIDNFSLSSCMLNNFSILQEDKNINHLVISFRFKLIEQ